MPTVAEIVDFLEDSVPLELAEEWDNVGLLVGDREQAVDCVMTCLTLTPDVAAEAIAQQCHLIVTHHPVLFRPIQKLTGDSPEGRMLLELIAAGIAVYSPHTAFDSAADGINRMLAESLGLTDVVPLRPAQSPELGADTSAALLGGGRAGRLPSVESLAEFNVRVKAALGVSHLQFVGEDSARIERVAVACGAAAEFLSDARRHECDVLLTGEARFHACLEARTTGVALVLPGHYATERPAVEQLARRIAAQFSNLSAAPSDAERDPLRWSI